MKKRFSTVKQQFKTAFQNILLEQDSYQIGEAAIPAYANTNKLIDYLFWKRLEQAVSFAKKHRKTGKVLDFGCGTGVLSSLLEKEGYEVTGIDVEFSPLELVKKKVEFANTIKFTEGDIITLEMAPNQFDIIFALDVLEHIEDLDSYFTRFQELLKPNGIVIISGPTENWLYKLGRKLAGKRYTGDYHVTNIYKIKRTFAQFFPIIALKKLFFPLVLFEVFVGKKNDVL